MPDDRISPEDRAFRALTDPRLAVHLRDLLRRNQGDNKALANAPNAPKARRHAARLLVAAISEDRQLSVSARRMIELVMLRSSRGGG